MTASLREEGSQGEGVDESDGEDDGAEPDGSSDGADVGADVTDARCRMALPSFIDM